MDVLFLETQGDATSADVQTSTSIQLQVLRGQEVAVAKRLAAAESRLRTYEQDLATLSSGERDLNILVRQQRVADVASLRAELDGIRHQMDEVRSGTAASPARVVGRVPEGPDVVSDVPASFPSTEQPLTIFGLHPRELRGPAEFVLLLPLIVALSRWIWRRSPARPQRDDPSLGNAQINRLEQSVEAIAIEVERISEAQRFSAKLMAERPREGVIERIRDTVQPQRRAVTPLP